jgi:hypothetical protein
MKKGRNNAIADDAWQKIEAIETEVLDAFWIKEEQLAGWIRSPCAHRALAVILLSAFLAGLPSWFVFPRYSGIICQTDAVRLAGEAVCNKELRELAKEIVSTL